ncbi:MAG: NAD(P)H-quinone oxidoreductase [Marmoricola sp.]
MRAVIVDTPGGPENLTVGKVTKPKAGPGEVVIEVVASAVNRADLLQRMGFYPPPPGASDIIGLECSGRIAEVGDGVTEWSEGDEVCALLAGGGYAERVAVPVGQVMPVPDGVDLATAASLPEVAATVWSNLIEVARLQSGERFLIHGGAGGIGSFAIQFAKALGTEVCATVGSPEKGEHCRQLGADYAIDYRNEDFVAFLTSLGGADVILDVMGAKYLERNITALAPDGRLVIIGMQGGVRGDLNIADLLGKRGSVSATSLRARPTADKARICAGVVRDVWPLIASGAIKTTVSREFPLDEVADAHRYLESGEASGKLLLRVS